MGEYIGLDVSMKDTSVSVRRKAANCSTGLPAPRRKHAPTSDCLAVPSLPGRGLNHSA